MNIKAIAVTVVDVDTVLRALAFPIFLHRVDTSVPAFADAIAASAVAREFPVMARADASFVVAAVPLVPILV